MTTEGPSPNTTLVILLGASAWPRSPELDASIAFANAANDLKAYFLDPQNFHLPQENLLDLFDSDYYADAMDEEIAQFLHRHIVEKKAKSGSVAKDVLVYFIGHGGIPEGDSDLYLTIRRTRKENPKGSSIEIGNLAKTLKDRARFQRRMVILDCCFAASAVRFFQGSGPMDVLRTQAVGVFEEQDKGVGFPGRGTALLCSSSSKVRSRFSPDETSTYFTQAFLHTLRAGNSFQAERLSLHTVNRLTQDYLSRMHGNEAPMPEVHSPDQVEGDVAAVAFFPNLAARAVGDKDIRIEAFSEGISGTSDPWGAAVRQQSAKGGGQESVSGSTGSQQQKSMSKNDDQTLAEELSRLGGSVLKKSVAKSLSNDTYEISFEMAIPKSSVVSVATSILNAEGKLLSTEEISSMSRVNGLIGAGILNLNPALVNISITAISHSQTHIRIQGKAKEGLIKQYAGKKAAQRVAHLLLGRLKELI